MQRRIFLKSMALSSASLIAIGNDAWAASTSATARPDQRKLIVVMLRGAIDGLNVVAPYADPNYARLRPTIALARPGMENGALDLDGRFGLHPALAPLMPLWQKRQLAFVHASGSPDPTRSHFDAQDYLESGTPGRKSTQDGWLNRLVATLPGAPTPTRAVSVGAVLPRILAGRINSTLIANGAASTRADLLDRPNMAAAFDGCTWTIQNSHRPIRTDAAPIARSWQRATEMKCRWQMAARRCRTDFRPTRHAWRA